MGVEEKGHLSGTPPNVKFETCADINSRSLSESELNGGEGLLRMRGVSVVLFRGVSVTLLLVLEQGDMDGVGWMTAMSGRRGLGLLSGQKLKRSSWVRNLYGLGLSSGEGERV